MAEEDWTEVVKAVNDKLCPQGFECHPFKIGWYNDMVAKQYFFPYDYDTLAILVISTPDMFDKAFKPYLMRCDCTGGRDPLDKCIEEQFVTIKQTFPDYDIEGIHDFEMLPSRRPKVLVQTAGHASGAAYYYQRKDVQPDPWKEDQKIFGVSIHPKYGGWFALRGVLIFKNLRCPNLERKEPPDVVNTPALRQELLERFNYRWQDWTYRDVVPVEKQYSEEQKEYFATLPKDRKQVVENIIGKAPDLSENSTVSQSMER